MGPPLLRCACSPCSPYCSSAPVLFKKLGAERRAPRTDEPLTHLASPRGGKSGLDSVLTKYFDPVAVLVLASRTSAAFGKGLTIETLGIS